MLDSRPATAVITGASRGIGLAIARKLGQDGLKLLLTARHPTSLETAKQEFSQAGITCEIVTADVTKEADVERLHRRAIEFLGRVDALVNNAGSTSSVPFRMMGLEAWNQTIEANLTSAFLCTRNFLPDMLTRQYGRIVNIASIAGKIGFPYASAYCAAKHAVIGLTRALALETAERNVTVNAVCPGWVDTSMTGHTIENIVEKTGWPPEKARKFLEDQSPLGRLISPDEVADLVAFLISPAAGAINGQAINICGGQVPS